MQDFSLLAVHNADCFMHDKNVLEQLKSHNVGDLGLLSEISDSCNQLLVTRRRPVCYAAVPNRTPCCSANLILGSAKFHTT